MKNSCNKFPFNEPVFVEPVIKKRSEKTWKKRGRKRKQICEIEEEKQMIQPPAKITNVEFNAKISQLFNFYNFGGLPLVTPPLPQPPTPASAPLEI
ncbi:hypothetical protein BpHYR1_039233 [Brachionus plicatilis]|uniref:Uncharacterized protein n=1 Tax=Brachionus plicatilis TaxID=10195 RepID=A0A3M7SPD1_BRAPC|nr:hypothetical protein BpHYR1_039233 [Brachionus plicatilis]